MQQLVKSFLTQLLCLIRQTVFTAFCFGCDVAVAQGEFFCSDCQKKITPLVTKHFALGKKYTLIVYAVGSYESPLGALVKKKFNRSVKAAAIMGTLMGRYAQRQHLQIDFVVPIPLHWTRYAHRGYNQAAVAAAQVARMLNVPRRSVIARTKNTRFQFLLSRQERSENLTSAFVLRGNITKISKQLSGKHVLLIDDLCTSGTTLVHAAKIIARHNPASISALVCCRAL